MSPRPFTDKAEQGFGRLRGNARDTRDKGAGTGGANQKRARDEPLTRCGRRGVCGCKEWVC